MYSRHVLHYGFHMTGLSLSLTIHLTLLFSCKSKYFSQNKIPNKPTFLNNWTNIHTCQKIKLDPQMIFRHQSVWSRPQKVLLIAAIFNAISLTVCKGQPSELFYLLLERGSLQNYFKGSFQSHHNNYSRLVRSAYVCWQGAAFSLWLITLSLICLSNLFILKKSELLLTKAWQFQTCRMVNLLKFLKVVMNSHRKSLPQKNK